MKQDFCYAEFAVNGVNKRNNVFDVNSFKLGENRTDCYQSLFTFDETLKKYVNEKKSVSGFSGGHIAKGFIFDFDDRENLETIKQETVNFILHLRDTYNLPIDFIQCFFSGLKGFNVLIPIQLFTSLPIEPRSDFWKVYRSIALELANDFRIDHSIYELKRLIRIPNSQHSVSMLYKIPLRFSELNSLSIDEIKSLARSPRTINQISMGRVLPITALTEVFNKWNNHNFSTDSSIYNNADGDDDLLGGVVQGKRHNKLTKIIGTFVNRGFDETSITKVCVNWNKENEPPYNDDELSHQVKDLFKRFRTGNGDAKFIEFPICLLSLTGSNDDKLKKIICFAVREQDLSSELIINLNLSDVFDEYYAECVGMMKLFETYGEYVFTRIGLNFFLETLNGKVDFEVFSIYAGVVSYLGRTKKFPRPIANSIILYRSRGFKNKTDYDDFCENVMPVKLPSDYTRRKALNILGSQNKNMLHFASLKSGRMKYFSTFYKTDSAIINYLVEREKKKNDRLANESKLRENALLKLKQYRESRVRE
ncbi:MAG: primase C-terminal domain-containing protein [Ignavibacteriaceae bacterium]